MLCFNLLVWDCIDQSNGTTTGKQNVIKLQEKQMFCGFNIGKSITIYIEIVLLTQEVISRS